MQVDQQDRRSSSSFLVTDGIVSAYSHGTSSGVELLPIYRRRAAGNARPSRHSRRQNDRDEYYDARLRFTTTCRRRGNFYALVERCYYARSLIVRSSLLLLENL